MSSNDYGPHSLTHAEILWIPLSDGVRLAARLWMPEGAARNPVPGILEYIPYRRRDGSRDNDERTHPYLCLLYTSTAPDRNPARPACRTRGPR